MDPMTIENPSYNDLAALENEARQCGKRIKFIDVGPDRVNITVHFTDVDN